MLMNKQCRESNCFNKHARQVEGHYFYVDNPKPISYHFQLVCQILRKKKDKMREIFSRIKQHKKKTTDYFPTIEETIDFYGIEQFLENYWSCQERIEQIDKKFAGSSGEDEFDVLVRDISYFISQDASSHEQGLEESLSGGQNRRFGPRETTQNSILRKSDDSFDFFDDNKNLEMLNNEIPNSEDKSCTSQSDSEDGEMLIFSGKLPVSLREFGQDCSVELLSENGEGFARFSDLDYEFIKKYDATKEDKSAKKPHKELGRDFYRYRDSGSTQKNEVKPTNLAEWSKQLLGSSNAQASLTPSKSQNSGLSQQEQTTSYSNTNSKTVMTPLEIDKQTNQNYLSWKQHSETGSFLATPLKNNSAEMAREINDIAMTPLLNVENGSKLFGTQTSGFLSSELEIVSQSQADPNNVQNAKNQSSVSGTGPSILKEIEILPFSKNDDVPENNLHDSKVFEQATVQQAKSVINGLNSHESSVEHREKLDMSDQENLKISFPKIAEKSKQKIQLIQVEGQSVFQSKKDKKQKRRGKRGVKRRNQQVQEDKLPPSKLSMDSKSSQFTEKTECLVNETHEGTAGEKITPIKEIQVKITPIPAQATEEPKDEPSKTKGKKLDLKIDKIESINMTSAKPNIESTLLTSQESVQKQEAPCPPQKKGKAQNSTTEGAKISKQHFRLKKQSFSDDSDSDEDQELITEDGNERRVKKLDPGFEPEVLEHYAKLEIQDAVNLDIWQKAYYDKIDVALPRQEKKKLRKKIKKKIRKEKERRERQLDDCIYIDGLNIEDIKDVTRFQDDLANFNSLNYRFLKDQGFEMDISDQIVQRFNHKSLPEDLIRRVLKHMPNAKKQKTSNDHELSADKFEHIPETDESIECTLDNLRDAFVDFKNSVRERQRNNPDLGKFTEDLKNKAYDQVVSEFFNSEHFEDFVSEHKLILGLEPEGLEPEKQIRMKSSNNLNLPLKRSKSQGSSYPEFQNREFQMLRLNRDGISETETQDLDDDEDEDDYEDEYECATLSQESMEDKAFKQIFACEVQFEQYKNFRVLAESLYEISHEAESVDTPYSAIISMLNYKPVDTRFPIYYEKTEEATKFIIPIEDSLLMPTKDQYPFQHQKFITSPGQK